MPALKNPRRELFCRNVIEGAKLGLNYTEAYRASGYKGEGHTAEVGASRLMSQAEVQQRISELGSAATKKVKATAADLLQKAEVVYDRAVETDKLSDANRAVELQGKLGGALIDRVEVGQVGAFSDCATPEAVIKKWLEDTEPQVMIELLQRMISLVEQYAAATAKPVAKPKVAEAQASARSAEAWENALTFVDFCPWSCTISSGKQDTALHKQGLSLWRAKRKS